MNEVTPVPDASSAGGWRSDPDHVAPTVLLLGGLFTSPLMYRAMRRRLLERGAAAVVVANVWLPDWLIAMRRGMGAILTRASRALLTALAASAGSPESRGAPLLVVGHSAGGLTARLLMSPEPFLGRRLGGARHIGAVVTLGTPHMVAERRSIGRLLAAHVTSFADRVVPGSLFAPATGYLAVSSRFVVGRPGGNVRERAASMLYRGMLPLPRAETIDGDGLVPVIAAGLGDAEVLVLDGIVHGQFGGSPWYGSPEAIDIWWPRAVEVWRAALRARIENERVEAGQDLI
jgi:hypothetical protein